MRLIDADALKERAIRVSTVKEHCYMKAVGTREIDRAPTVDAAIVVHGRWERGKDRKPYCSACGGRALMACTEDPEIGYGLYYYKESKICPNCGAKMDH